MDTLILKPGREKALKRRHPWIYSGAVDGLVGEPQSGDTVLIQHANGDPLALAAYSPHSQIRARVWSWDTQIPIDAAFFRDRLAQAIRRRHNTPGLDVSPRAGVRLVYAESDGIPGVVVDRYADVAVIQLLTAGAERWREELADLVIELTGTRTLYERSDVAVRALEGLPTRVGLLRGDPLTGTVEIEENEIIVQVDIAGGHKTGYYLDQRENRGRVRDLAAERAVLDCFAYSGGFSLAALAGGAASVTGIEASEKALAEFKKNIQRNGFGKRDVKLEHGDVFHVLRSLRDRGREFDLIILDPPKFAPTAAQARQAARGYKDINLLALKLLTKGGLLATFSCSGGINLDLFQKIVAGAALDAGVDARILDVLGQASDHPIALNFPEGSYLKGLLVQG